MGLPPSSSIVTSSATFATRSPRLQSYLTARGSGSGDFDPRSKSPWSSRSRYDLESSRSRSYSHSGLYDGGQSYRSRSSSVRETSPYDSERDRDLVLSMRSQSAMSSNRSASQPRPPTSTYTSAGAYMDVDPMISTYSRSLTSDPLMTSSIVSGSGAAGQLPPAARLRRGLSSCSPRPG